MTATANHALSLGSLGDSVHFTCDMKKILNPQLVTSSWTETDLHGRTVAVSRSDNHFDTVICRLHASSHSDGLWIDVVLEATHVGGNTFRTRRHTLSQSEANSIACHADESIAEFSSCVQPLNPAK